MGTNLYVKAVVYLLSITGLGYGLMILTTPSAAKIAEIKATKGAIHLTEEEKKKFLFLKKLQEAANLKKADN